MGHYLSEMGAFCKKHKQSYVRSCDGCVKDARRKTLAAEPSPSLDQLESMIASDYVDSKWQLREILFGLVGHIRAAKETK